MEGAVIDVGRACTEKRQEARTDRVRKFISKLVGQSFFGGEGKVENCSIDADTETRAERHCFLYLDQTLDPNTFHPASKML